MAKLYYKSQLFSLFNPLVFEHQKRTKKRFYASLSGEICEKCGEKAEDRHHIDQNWEDDRKKNIMLLCKSCHKVIHNSLPRRFYKYKVKKIIREDGSFFFLAKIANLKVGADYDG